MSKIQVTKVCVGALIKNSSNKYLIIRRSKHESLPGLWEIPSGKKEFLESVEIAVVREVLEEVGLKVKVNSLANYFEYTIEKESETRDTVQLNFNCFIEGIDTVTLSSDHDAFAWIDLKSIGEYGLSDSTKSCILQVLK